MTSTAALLSLLLSGAAFTLYLVSARQEWLVHDRLLSRSGFVAWCTLSAAVAVSAPLSAASVLLTPLLISLLPCCYVREQRRFRCVSSAAFGAAAALFMLLALRGDRAVFGFGLQWLGGAIIGVVALACAAAIVRTLRLLKRDPELPAGPFLPLFSFGVLLWAAGDVALLLAPHTAYALLVRSVGHALLAAVLFARSDLRYSSRFSQRASIREPEEEERMAGSRSSLTEMLATSVTHDVRHMLHNIGLAAAGGLAKGSPEAHRESLELVHAYAERGGDSLFELLNMIRNPKVERDATSVPDEINGLFGIAERLARRRDTEFVVDFGGGGSVAVGKPLLWEIVYNLIFNALGAVERAPVRSVHVRFEWATESVFVIVSDSGPGVPTESAEAVFEAGMSGKEGSGLGLHIAQRIVRRYGGEIRYHPVNGWSAFRVALPRVIAGGGRL